jgi:four helix bundle protein
LRQFVASFGCIANGCAMLVGEKRRRLWLGSSHCRSVLERVQAKPASPVPAQRGQPGPALRALRRDGALGPEGVTDQESIMTLKIYPIVLELIRKLTPYLPALRARSSSLGDQLERALVSIPLNLAEGAYSRGKNRQARYQSAAASAREALACLETAEALGWLRPLDPELGALFNRIIGTLVRLIEPRR